MGIVNAVDDLVLQPFFYMRPDGLQTRNAVDDIDGQVEAIHLVDNRQFQWSIDVALFFISAHVNVLVIGAAVGELMDEGSIGVKVEDYGLVGGKQRIEVAVGESMRMFGRRHEAEEIDGVDEADLQVREVLLQNLDGRERLH